MSKTSKIFNRGVALAFARYIGDPMTINSQDITVYSQDENGDVLLAVGTATISDGAAGYAKGCLYIDTDVGAGSTGIYENVGTTTACNFDTIGSGGGGATTFITLTDCPANYTAAANKILKVNSGATGVEFVTMSGDVSINATGVAAIGTGVIVNDDINAAAAIAYSKLAALTSAHLLIGSAGNVATDVALTGDVAVTNAGLTTVTDLTITGEAQGDVLYRNAANWVRLAAGTAGNVLITAGAGSNPYWGAVVASKATSLSNSCTLDDGGALDAILAFTQQTVAAPTLTIPDFASVSDEFVFKTKAVTLANKTLTSPVLTSPVMTTPQINDTSADHQYIYAVSELAADRTVTMPLLLGDDTFVFADFIQTLTNKTLTSPVLTTPQINDTSADHQYIFAVNELAADRTVTLPLLAGDDVFVFADFLQTLTNKTLSGNVATGFLYATAGNAITFQDAIHTVIGRDTSDTLTNKTLDCDGTGNVVSNVNANELDPITFGASTFGIPFIVTYNLSNQAVAVNVFNANCPFKLRVIKAWSIATSGDGGSWKLNNGALGAGTDITNAVAVAASDMDFDEPTDYDDAAWEIAANGSLSVVPDGAGLLDAMIFVQCMRVD